MHNQSLSMHDNEGCGVHRYRAGAILALSLIAAAGHAAVFRCVDSKGVSTYSDRPCTQSPAGSEDTAVPAAAQKIPASSDNAALTPKELKARQILNLLSLTPDAAGNSNAVQQTIDAIAPDLVKRLDPGNEAWNPQNARWHTMLELVKTDLRKDLASALRASAGQILQAEAKDYAAHAQETDMDALIQYLSSSEGSHYIAFQTVVRSITSQSLRELLNQEAVTAEQPSDAVIKQRQKLLSLGLEARLAADGGGPSMGSTFSGSPAVLDNAARREGTALDALYVEYESYVPNFATFSQSAAAKHFFAAAEPSYRKGLTLIGAASGGFADNEEFKYAQRWQAAYGPQLRSSRVTIVRNGYTGRTVAVVNSTESSFNSKNNSAEKMALQCEQREDSAYYARNRRSDPATQAAALKSIQDKCRGEQNLAPY
jgi:hypothetical protein